MYRKLMCLVSFALVLGLAVGVANAQPLQQDPGPDGIVSVEAEHFDANVEVGGHKWEETGPTGGFTGVLGMHAPNGRGGHSSNYAANSERLDYEINFVKTGPHYVWILAWGFDGSDDSCHAGLDGEETPLSDRMSGWSNDYEWNNGRYERPEPSQIEITTPGVHVLNIYVREDGLIIDKIVLTTNPNFTLTGSEPGPPESHRGARVIALDPIPADGATDVPRDVVLSWTAGALADKHDVYIGTVFDDVNQATATVDPGGIYQGRIAPSIYTPPERLAFSETYYWRVDEVNAPPDNTIREGGVWSFTTEPFVYAVENITATASSSDVAKGPENTVNGSGLDDSGLLHDKVGDDNMWLSGITGPQPSWIEFQFDNVYKLYEMWVWNSNESLELAIGFGFKDVTIEYSVNGIDYTTLGTTHEFARAPGASDYAHNTTVDTGGVAARYVRLTANSNWGGLLPQYGLSEVRFFYIPVYAREPSPDSGATDVSIGTIDAPADVTLGFRAGREAAKHDVYFSDSWRAVTNGTAAVTTVTEVGHGPLSLDLGKTYYWRVDEVNEAETPAMWQGDVWDFTTQEYFVMDDFESYNDLDTGDPESNRIFMTWLDGYDQPTNGSIVGYDVPPFTEQTIVHGDTQSMPLFYDNSGTANYSEATLTLSSGRDWTIGGVKALSLWFHGDPNNAAGQIYVKVNDSKVVYDGDAGDIARLQWTQWNIDLASLGAGLQNITKLSIGIDDSGASGTLYVDDIWLYPSRCILSRRSADFAKLDYVEDCVVNYGEFEVMAEEWLLEELIPSGAGEIWFEAESADIIGANWRIYDDPNSSGGKHIGSENGDGNDNDNPPGAEWVAVYNFTVSGGVYKVLLRGQEADSDSFWVRIPGATNLTPGEDPDNPGTGWVRFNGMDAQGGWNWDEVHSDDHDQQVANWTLPGGTHTLEIAKREDGTWLDAILITDNLDLVPVTLSHMPADLNEDKRVDFKDYAILADAWLDEQLWPAP